MGRVLGIWSPALFRLHVKRRKQLDSGVRAAWMLITFDGCEGRVHSSLCLRVCNAGIEQLAYLWCKEDEEGHGPKA